MTNQVPTAAQWNSYFGGKADVSGGSLNAPTITGGVVNNATLNNPTINGLSFTNLANTGSLTSSYTQTSSGGSGVTFTTTTPTGTSPAFVYGLTVTKSNSTVNQGSTSDSAIQVATNFAETNGKSWHNGIVFGTKGTASFPLDSTGSLITVEASDSNFTGIGVDMSGAFFATAQFKGMNFLVDPSGNVTAKSFIPTNFTVSTLPTCNTAAKGTLVYVTDATTPTYNASLTGSGAVVVLAFCNGTAWTAH